MFSGTKSFNFLSTSFRTTSGTICITHVLNGFIFRFVIDETFKSDLEFLKLSFLHSAIPLTN